MTCEIPAIKGRITPGVAALWHHYYGDLDPHRFSLAIAATATPAARVLEIGAGSGTGDQDHFDLRGKVAEYVGIDPDPRVLANPHLDLGVVGRAERLPFDDGSFDVVFHQMVAEHLPDPDAAMRETARVLKPGGRLLFQTPSRWYYPQVLARLTPHWFHEMAVGRLGSGRKDADVFPTVYRLNSRRQITRVLEAAGFDAPDIELASVPPGYLRFSRLSFMAGVLYERTVERVVPAARGLIIVHATKRSSGGKMVS